VRRAAEAFLALQGAITISAVSAIVALGWGLNHFQFLGWLRGYLAAYDPFDVTSGWQGIATWKAIFGPWPNFLSLYLVVPLVLMAAPTVMMGISFPFLQSAVQDDSSLLGRRVGWLQASNIFGATIGTILVGGFLLDVMGTSWTLRLIVALGAIFLFLSVKQIFESDANRKIGYVFAALLAAAPIGGVQSGTKLWAKLHGATADNIIVAEDGTGLAVLKNSRVDFSDTTWVFTNGLGQSWIPYHQFNVIHSRLGVLPALMHPDPKEIAVIGLGSGDTLFGLGGREETQEITCIEIVAPQLKVLTDLGMKRPYGGVDSLLNDRRIRFVFADGRRYLRASSKKYDIVEADALRPNSAFAGNLYSVEYFELLKSRLKPGGLALTWAPTARTVNTFAKVFPHTVNFGAVLVGSNQPIEFNPDVIRQRLEHPFTKAYYARADLNLNAIMGPLLVAKPEALRVDPQQIRSSSTNTDLSPKDEYGR
jgi:spermidine synthase